MPKKEVKHIGLRVAPEVHRKLAYISKYEGRSINGQVYHLIQNAIVRFEFDHGTITEKDMDNADS